MINMYWSICSSIFIFVLKQNDLIWNTWPNIYNCYYPEISLTYPNISQVYEWQNDHGDYVFDRMYDSVENWKYSVWLFL